MMGSAFRLRTAIFVLLCFPSFGHCGESLEEFLWIRRLPSGHIHTRMEFVISRDMASNSDHSTLFPRSLSEILIAHKVQELHFTLTQGHWRLESWGDPFPAKTAPTGAHVVAWFLSNSSNEADTNWRGLTNRMSGLSCASLNFLDETTSINPEFAYRPVGSFLGGLSPSEAEQLHVRVGSLPREFICTENLTPWTKLLPCGVMRGIASLLRSKQVFNTHYHSAHLRYVQSKETAQIIMSLSMVFDVPPNSGENDNFLRTVVGSVGIFPCHPSTRTTIQLWNGNSWTHLDSDSLNSLKMKDVPNLKDPSSSDKNLVFTPVKYLGGYGQEYGKMVVEMTNHLTDQVLDVLYVEVLPWYVRPYFHTMNIEITRNHQLLPVIQGNLFHYTPGRDRQTLHKLEMDIQIPPSSKATLSFMVEKGHLKWDEYPPDANHGFYLEAAHFEVNTTNEKIQETRHFYSRVLLINLPTPDFSMPYNVICLTCTVVALAFGPIHNITTKRLKLRLITPKGEKFKKLLRKLKFWSKATEEEEAPSCTSSDATKGGKLTSLLSKLMFWKNATKVNDAVPSTSSTEETTNEPEVD